MKTVLAIGVVEASRKKHSGNVAELREALKRLLNLAYEVQDANSECEYGPKTSVPTQFIIDVAKSALSAPPRNCDVGTVGEQETRYHATGELYHTLTLRNALTWAQMPYEEGGAK